MGRSFHRPGTVKEKVLESDFEPLCDGTTRRLSTTAILLSSIIFLKFMACPNSENHVSKLSQHFPVIYTTRETVHVQFKRKLIFTIIPIARD